MKITSGLFKGKSISRVGVSTTRETSNLVKQAVFNMLGDINGKSVLDFFLVPDNILLKRLVEEQ